MCRRAEQQHLASQQSTFDRGDILALGVFAGGLCILVLYVIPRIEIAIALFDRIIGG
jgi:hypothetical protein